MIYLKSLFTALAIALTVVLSPNESSANTTEDFEQGTVPSGWTSEPDGSLSVIDARKKSGEKCLLWKWKFNSDQPDTRTTLQEYLAKQPTHFGVKVSYLDDNVLTIKFPKPLEQSDLEQRGLSFWYQRPRGGDCHLRLEILSGDKVIGRGWYLYSRRTRGWQPCNFPYSRLEQKGPVTGFRLLAPTGDVPQWVYCSADCLCMDDLDINAPKVTYNGTDIDPLDGDTVPAGWDAGTKGKLKMTHKRYFSGDACLQWTWDKPGASLTYTNPAGFSRVDKKQNFAFWVYNETPSSKQLRLEFWNKDQKLGDCYYNLGFQGWHVLAAPYEEIDSQGADRVRLLAPADMPQGKLYLDFVNLQCYGQAPGGYRPKTPLADSVQPWSRKPELLKNPLPYTDSMRDLSIGRPWIPPLISPDKMTAKQKADLEKLRGKLATLPQAPKDKKGTIPTAVMDQLQAHLEHWNIQESDGIVTGHPIVARLNPPPDAFHISRDFEPLLQRALQAHALARKVGDDEAAEQLAKTCSMLMDFAADQGLFSCSDNFHPIVFDVNRLEQVKVVATPEAFEKMLRGIFFGMGFGSRMCEEEPPGDTDTFLYNYSKLLPIIAWIPDPAERLQKYQAISRGGTRIGKRVDFEPFGPDGTCHHHAMHHWDYASYEIPTFIHMIEQLRGTDLQFGPEMYEDVKRWIFTMAHSACKYTMPANLPARPGEIRKVNMADLAKRLDECWPNDHDEVDRDLASLYLALTDKPDSPAAKKYRDLGIKPYSFDGHHVINGAAISTHRRDDWMVAVVGQAVHRRGLEIYGGEKNSSSRFGRNGTLAVVSSGNPTSCEASGWSFDGWDSFHYPGSTNPLSKDQMSIQSNYYLLGGETLFAGGTDLDGDGIWGYEHKCSNTPKHQFKKSVFFFGRRVTAITTDIEHLEKSNDPFVTTLYQNAFVDKPEDEPSYVDGKEEKSFPSEETLSTEQNHWLIDNKGTGYFVHAGQAALKVARHPQTWSYFGRDTSNNFGLAYLDHGPGPDVPDCVYTLVVRSNPDEMASFATAMENNKTAPYRIFQKDTVAHILWDRETNTTGYVLFGGDAWHPQEIQSDPRTVSLLSISRPCTVMIRENDKKNELQISVASTDWKNETPMVLTIAGSWKLKDIDTTQPCRVTTKDNTTSIEISYKFEKLRVGYMPIHLQLTKEP